MSTYQKAHADIYKRAQALMEKYHTNLVEAGVVVDIMFAFATKDANEEPKGHAIMHGGYPAEGLCKILSLKDRVMGRGDAEIILNGDHWNGWTPQQRDALLDHELHHLSVRASEDGIIQVDDIGRPKLEMRKHDREFGWFDLIAKRWGSDSHEVMQAKQLIDEAGSVYFQQSLSLDPVAS